ncbi:hypothetical protein [Streptomyces prunicolor]|uniref:hypothetical protein n=1 Tax=Streptomyces prunicolor TaxID=67348 RepID=UPI001319CC75|nr:hypothetical protein [Streptomyces prunicolor]
MNYGLASVIMGVAVIATLVSDAWRSVLRAIFRHPRKTSVIVHMDGTHLEVSGSSPEEIQKALDELLSKTAEGNEPTREGNEDEADSQPIVNQGVWVTGGAITLHNSAMGNSAKVEGQQSSPTGTNGAHPTSGDGSGE